ncbi:MAG: hypothetical protein AABZ39_19310 [Spirochaetota bacterium]
MNTIRSFIVKHPLVTLVLAIISAGFILQLALTIALDIAVRGMLASAFKDTYRISKAWVTFSWWGGVRIGRISVSSKEKPAEKIITIDELILSPDYRGYLSSFDIRRAVAVATVIRPRVYLPLPEKKMAAVPFSAIISNAVHMAEVFSGRTVIIHDGGISYVLPSKGERRYLGLINGIDAVLEISRKEYYCAVNTRFGSARCNIAATIDPALLFADANILVYDSEGIQLKYGLTLRRTNGIVRGDMTDRRDVSVGSAFWDSDRGTYDVRFSHDRLRPTLIAKALAHAFPAFYDAKTTGVLQVLRNEVEGLSLLAVDARLRRNEIGSDRYVSLRMSGGSSEVRLRVSADDNGVTADARVRYGGGSANAQARFAFSGPFPERVVFSSSSFPLGASRLTARINAESIGSDAGQYRYRIGIYDMRFGDYYGARAQFVAGYETSSKTMSFLSTHEGFRVAGSICSDPAAAAVADISVAKLPLSLFTAFSGLGALGGSALVDLGYTAVRIKGKEVHRLTSSVSEGFTGRKIAGLEGGMDDARIECRDLFVHTGLGTVRFSGMIDGTTGDAFSINGSLKTPAGIYPIGGSIAGKERRTIAIGSKDGNISVNGFAGMDGVRIMVRTGLLPIHQRISAGIRLLIDTAATNGIVSGSLTMRERSATPISAGASFRLMKELVLDTLYYEWGGLRLTGSGTVGMRDDVLHAEAALFTPASNGTAMIDLDVNGERINSEIKIDNISSAHFVHVPNVMGDIAARIEVGGTFSDPYITLRKFSLLRTDIFGDRYDITCRGTVRNGEVALFDGVMKKTGARGYPVTDEQLIYLRRIFLSPDQTDIQVECRNFDYLSVFDGALAIRSVRRGKTRYVSASTANFLVNKKAIPPFSFVMDDRDGVAIFSSQTGHGLRGTLTRGDRGRRTDVRLGYFLDNNEQISAKGFVQDGIARIAVTSSTMTAAPLALLSHFLFVRLDGEAYLFEKNGKKYTLYLDATGPLGDLSFSGRFRSRAQVRLNLFQNEFRDCVLDLGFENKRIVANECSFRDGAAAVTVNGSVSIARNMIDQLAFRVISSSNTMLTASADLGFLRLDGPAAFHLDFSESFLFPRITGAVQTRNSDIMFIGGGNSAYRPRFGEFFINAAWNLAIAAGNSVHFYNAIVGDSYIKDGSSMRILGRASDQTLALRGSIAAHHGTAYYLNNAYQLENLTVTFPELASFDPIIEGRGKTRKKFRVGSETLDVTLYLEVSGRFSEIMKNPMYATSVPARFYTVPAVKDEYVRELVGLPAAREERTPGSAEDEMQRTLASVLPADMIMRDSVLRPLERNVRRFTGLDYFGIETGAFSRLSMSLLTNTLSGVLDNPGYFLQDTRVSFGKYLPFNQIANFLPEIYLKYNLTIIGNLGLWEHERVLQHELAVELDLAQFSDLANFIFEYTIDPSSVTNIEQKISVSTRWRF